MSEQTTDATSRALDMVEKFAGKLTETVQQYGPDATSLALEVGRVSAIQAVAVPAAVLLVVVPLGYYCVRLIIWGINHSDESGDGPAAALAFGAIGSVGCTIGSMVAAAAVLNVPAWVGMFRPEIYLAYRALGL